MKLPVLGLCVILAACGGSSLLDDGGIPTEAVPAGDGPGERDGGADLPGPTDGAVPDGAVPDGAVPDGAAPDTGPLASWNKVAAPTTSRLTGVHGTSPGDVWAAGKQLLRFDGTTWSVAAAQAADRVWAVSPTDVWSLSATGVRHWVGGAWDLVSIPGAAPGTTWLDLWGASGHIWACGVTKFLPPASSALARFDSASWTLMSINGLTESFSGTGPVDIWAVGQDLGNAAIWHYDGTGWQPSPTTSTKPLHGVWAVSAADVWAVGQQQILHWDGSSWTDATPPTLGQGWLVGAWGAGSAIWAVGYADRDTNTNTFGHGIVYHHDGSGWKEVTVPGVIDASTPALFDVWAAGPADVWAVGDSGTLLHYAP